MPKYSYSLDIRKKVIDFVKSGATQKQAGEHFGLHYNTVNNWWLRYKQEGHYIP